MPATDHLTVQLHLPKTRTAEELMRNYYGRFPWSTSRQKIIAEPARVGYDNTVVIPHDLARALPTVILNFREFLSGNRVEICTGQRGRALRPYFHGDGYLGNGALFSVPSSITVFQAFLQGELVQQTITLYTAILRRDNLQISETVILKDAFVLPEALEHYRLPFDLVQGYLLGTEQYAPLYWTETDQFLKGCYGEDTVDVGCVKCSTQHTLPIETLLADQAGRLLLCRNYGE